MPRFAALLSFFIAAVCFAQSEHPLLLQKPTINATDIVFTYAGDLWKVSRAGGDAARLTAGPGLETDPYFSPDGAQIAFTGEYDGNVDVYVIPADGGVPKRITYHPSADNVRGWTPDGKQILFRSYRDSYSRFARLFTMPMAGGGLPDALPLPMAEEASYSPDGKYLAYVPLNRAFLIWKHYRGGEAAPIWIANLADSSIEKLPRNNSNDFAPMWVGNHIYFLSDRNGPITLFSYDTVTKKVTELVHNTGLDIKNASAGPGAIVYEQFGGIHIYDLKTGKEHPVDIRVAGDLPEVRPHFENVNTHIANAGISPTGERAVFEAHGEILTVPADKGSIRNLTNTPGVEERDPAWSPDGSQIAYFSDESGEYQLAIRDQEGMGPVTRIKLGDKPSFYYGPVWSPDGKKIAYTTRLTLWYIDLEKKTPVKVDADTYDSPSQALSPAWSPDSKWIAYTRLMPNHLRAAFLYSVDEGASHQLSDGMSDAQYACFDKNGKYLYFAASTNQGLSTAWLDMSGIAGQATYSVYLAVLNKDDPSPLAPQSDDEKKASADDKDKNKDNDKDKNKDKAKEPVTVKVDIDNIGQRIVATPIPARNYVAMMAGKEGTLFLLEMPPGPARQGPPNLTAYKFDLKDRKTDKLIDGVRSLYVSSNGEKMLFRQGDKWTIAATSGTPKAGEGVLKMDDMEVRVNPRAEWKQMYHEVWRIERDFFYDPGLHGLDWRAAEKKYEPYLDQVASRDDLTYLFQEMLGNITVGHMYVGGGTEPAIKHVKVGLLGADYSVENGRYKFARVYAGENWNPQLRAPLTGPGVHVTAGEYLLAVNGIELHASDNLYSFFEETAGKSVLLKVGPDASGKGSREVTVEPIESETSLRNRAWMDDNRRKVDQLSGGRLAYVYLPNTAEAGYTNFNRYYFAQVGKQGAVIDERFNGGGDVADYIVDNLSRPLMCLWHTREGADFTTPQDQIFGPKAMLINEMAGSGGDALPWMFRERHVGTLVGKRTWGGLVGIFNFPQLMDGGFVTAPNLAFYNLTGEWDVENHGVAPDIEVEFDPAAVRAGHDPQLEKAVTVLLGELDKHPLPTYKRPKFPNYHRTAAAVTGQ